MKKMKKTVFDYEFDKFCKTALMVITMYLTTIALIALTQ